MGYDHGIDRWNVFDFTWNLCVSLRSKPGKRTASCFEYRVKQYSKTSGEFDEIAGVAQPRSSKGRRLSDFKEGWLSHRYSRRCRIWPMPTSGDSPPKSCQLAIPNDPKRHLLGHCPADGESSHLPPAVPWIIEAFTIFEMMLLILCFLRDCSADISR